MIDTYGRHIQYLRISITDRCNLYCTYCRSGQQNFLPQQQLLSFDEIITLCKGAANVGIQKIRLTGGEPLVRDDIVELVEEIKAIKNIQQIHITTNGVLLSKYAQKLQKAGLSGINVSLDSISQQTYTALTGKESLSEVLSSIKLCGALGLPVKLNCVPIVGKNDTELISLVSLAQYHDIQIRFIEVMPIGEGAKFTVLPSADIQKQIEAVYGTLYAIPSEKLSGPAVLFTNESIKGTIGFIRHVSHGFCEQCNRIRVTCDGKLKLCLHHPAQLDLKPYLQSETAVVNALQHHILQKPEHGFITDETIPMWKIGG